MEISNAILIPISKVAKHFPMQILSLRLRRTLGRPIQNPPHSFYDKLFWLSCHTDIESWARLADKYAVREYVTQQCGSSILTDIYGIYDSPDEIDFDCLPTQFVLKTNNACAFNLIIKDKSAIDYKETKRVLNKWIKTPYGELSGQRHYTLIKPKIMAEELLQNNMMPDNPPVDYKFFCFDGVPTYCYVYSERVYDSIHSHKRMLYDMNWKALPEAFEQKEEYALKDVEQPASLEYMKEIATKLSKGYAFTRIDLYDINGNIKFGEITFMPGMHSGFTEEFQEKLGSLINIS